MPDYTTPDPQRNDPIARLLRDLPEESPSLAWRASLNEKIRNEGVRRTRARWWSFGSVGLGLTAASFAALLILPTMLTAPVGTTPSPFGSVGVSRPVVSADDLLALDGEGTATAEVSGAGLAARESDLTEGEIRDVLVSQML